MDNILETIAKITRHRIIEVQRTHPLAELKKKAEAMQCNTGFPFEKALRKEKLSFICEIKKASPSKGVLVEKFPYLQIAKDYEQAGADAISCLTEPYYFKGSNVYLQEIANTVSIPVLRKDFTISSYMVYEAKVLGASAILLICSLLSEEKLKQYLEIAHTLGLSALVEVHTANEIEKALRCGAKIIGVNNRDLKTFHVDTANSETLRKYVPKDCIFVSESGIQTPKDITKLKEIGTDAVLIGETLMKAQNKKEMLQYLQKGAIL